MHRLPLTVVWLGAMGIALAGCEHRTIECENTPVPAGTVSVHSLAGRLGMRVEQTGRTLATLSGPSNRILVLGQPDSRVFVNGRPVGPAGQVCAVGDTLFVPLSMEPAIRAAMRYSPGPDDRGAPGGTAIVRGPRPGGGPYASPGRTCRGTVVVDAGHGGKDPGAVGAGLREKTLNLAVALLVAEDLRARGARVVLTRRDDTFVELPDRVGVSNDSGADLFLSIHANSNGRPEVAGFQVYVGHNAAPASVAAAMAIANRMEQAGLAPYGPQPARNERKLQVLENNRRPCVLLEMGFLSNRGDAARLAQSSHHQTLARAVADGVADYLNRRDADAPPRAALGK